MENKEKLKTTNMPEKERLEECFLCHKPIPEGRVCRSMGKPFHAICLERIGEDECILCHKPIPNGEEKRNEWCEPLHKECYEIVEKREMVPIPVVFINGIKAYMERHPNLFGSMEDTLVYLARRGIEQEK